MPNTTERDTLVAQCARTGLDHSGTTHQLRKRLLDHMMCKEKVETATPVPAEQETSKKRKPTA